MEGLKRIDRYLVVRELGRGTMGVVYEGFDPGVGRKVAIKLLHRAPGMPAAAFDRFAREGRVAARLEHPGIARVYDTGELQGAPYLVMELVEGKTLGHILDDKVVLPAKAAAQIGRNIARALHYAHDKGVIHRDVKPGNIMLRPDGRPALTDFGLARDLMDQMVVTLAGAVIGTPSYMAPEQAQGESNRAGPAADIYGLGAVLYHCIAGCPPYTGSSWFEILPLIVSEPLVPPSRRRSETDPALEAIVLRAMARKPEERYASAFELGKALDQFLALRT